MAVSGTQTRLGVESTDERSPPAAAPGAHISVSPLLVLEVSPPPAEQELQQQPKSLARPGGSESTPSTATAPSAAPPSAVQSRALESAYWDWRLHYDLLQVDTAFLVFTASQALLISSRDGGGGQVAMALLLAACALQFGCMLCMIHMYAKVRVPLLCTVRCLHSCAGWLAQRALQQRLESGLVPLAGAASTHTSAVQLVLACTGIGRLVLQPLGLQLPFRLALPLQLVDFILARNGGAVAMVHLTRFLEAAGQRLGTALHLAYDTLDGLFHVSTALLFPGAYDITLMCSQETVELLVVFLQLLCGCMLPLYIAYVTELSSKVRYVQRWAAKQGLGVRITLSRFPGSGSSVGGPVSNSVGSGSGGTGYDVDGSYDGDGSASSRSGGSWRSSRSSGERAVVHLDMRGPLTMMELECVSEGRVIAAHTHIAWLLLLVISGWGLTTQLQLKGTSFRLR